MDVNGSDSTNKLSNKRGAHKKSETDIRCSICGTDFSTNEYYARHLGTKKHKRNKRRFFKDMPYKETFQLHAADHFVKDCSYKAVKEKYRQRNIRHYESNYTSYIWSVTAYWATTLAVDPNIRNFKISLNDKTWGDFGDVVIEVEFTDLPVKTSVTKTFAIQFKQIVSNKFRNIESLGEGSFSFQNVIGKLSRVQGERNLLEHVSFIVFTTAAVSPALNMYNPVSVAFCTACFKLEHRRVCDLNCKADNNLTTEVPVYAKALSDRRKKILDTSDGTQSTYFFFSSDSEFVLPKIYLYTSQKTPKHFPGSIEDIFFEVLDGRRPQISRELIKFVENWSEGRYGGTYKLQKEDVLVKLGQLLLFKFVVTPKVPPTDPDNDFDVWLETVDTAHVTVLKDTAILSAFCEPMNRVIEKELGLKIDVTHESVQILGIVKERDSAIIGNQVLRDYFLEELRPHNYNDDGNIPLENVYLAFWKAGLIPMILHVNNANNQKYVLQVINLLIGFGLNRRYFLKTSDVHIKTSAKSFKNIRFFVTLDDVVEKLDQSLLDRVKIIVTDAFALSFKTIRKTDKLFQKTISAEEFFDMSLEKYVFRPSLRTGGVEELKLVLSYDQMKSLKQEVESKRDFKYVLQQESHHLRGLNPKLFI